MWTRQHRKYNIYGYTLWANINNIQQFPYLYQKSVIPFPILASVFRLPNFYLKQTPQRFFRQNISISTE